MSSSGKSLYERLGGYDKIAAVVADLLGRLRSDSQLRRFWENRGTENLHRELQLLIDFFCSRAGGPVYYMGHDVATVHGGMRINESDWKLLEGHMEESFTKFGVPDAERRELTGFIESFKHDIVE